MLPTEVRYETEVYRWFHEYAVEVGRAGGITTIWMRPFFYCAIIRPIMARSSDAISTFDFSIRIFPPVII